MTPSLEWQPVRPETNRIRKDVFVTAHAALRAARRQKQHKHPVDGGAIKLLTPAMAHWL